MAVSVVGEIEMPESPSHRRLKNRDAGINGRTEYTLPSGRRLDALSPTKIAVEIERGGPNSIRKSVSSLKEATAVGIARKARLRVPEWNLDIAYDEMRRQRLGGELTNLGGTTKIDVPKKRRG